MANLSVTDAFQKALNQRRMNIVSMFKNPDDESEEVQKGNTDDDDLVELPDEEDEEEKGCGDNDIEKEDDSDEREPEDDDEEDEEPDEAKKAEIVEMIGQEQLDVWKSQIDDLANASDIEKAQGAEAIDAEIGSFAEVSEIRKSDILYALSGCGNGVNFVKTGKELKDQINNVVSPEINANRAAAKAKADEILADCGAAPTTEVPIYWTGEVHYDVGYKIYNWDETIIPKSNNSLISSFSPESYKERCCSNTPSSEEEAKNRCKYNEQVNKIANIMTDIKTCEMVAKNVKDNERVQLNVRQLIAFKFS